jgi:hypothetical protein
LISRRANIYCYRKPRDRNWIKFQEVDIENPGNLYRLLSGFYGIVGVSLDNPNLVYLIDNLPGKDKAGLSAFDFPTAQFGRMLR